MISVAGVDGARGGWVVATLAPGQRVPSMRLVGSFREVAAGVGDGTLGFVAIDMPIGLAGDHPRPCDVAARRLLGPRRSTVFPAPVRAVVGAADYQAALAASRQASGVGLSKQSYNLLAKIAEVEASVRVLGQGRIAETHPELAFAVLAGGPLEPKRTAAGLAARLDALCVAFGEEARALGTLRLAGAKTDDILDAAVLAWSARRQAAGNGERVGGEDDGTGLRMEVCW